MAYRTVVVVSGDGVYGLEPVLYQAHVSKLHIPSFSLVKSCLCPFWAQIRILSVPYIIAHFRGFVKGCACIFFVVLYKYTQTQTNMENQNQNDLKQELLDIKECVEKALNALEQGNVEEARELIKKGLSAVPIKSLVVRPATEPTKVPEGSRIIEGVFDGQHMVGSDGNKYLVPPNYASKSKLIEGDMMKLSITPEGAFIYKQIGPIDRKRVTCVLEQNADGMWSASDGVHIWRLLTAAVTYFKGKEEDEVIILIPNGAPSKWAAVENIIAK